MNPNTQEPMIDGREAASAMRLPYYWFRDPTARAQHRIPHYLLGGLVRYRLSELAAWAARSNAVQSHGVGLDAASGQEDVDA